MANGCPDSVDVALVRRYRDEGFVYANTTTNTTLHCLSELSGSRSFSFGVVKHHITPNYIPLHRSTAHPPHPD